MSDAVSGMVRQFYDAVLSDRDLSPFFRNTDMEMQIRKMTLAMVALLGNQAIDGLALKRAHARFVSDGLTDFHFNRVWSHLQVVLEANGVPAASVALLGSKLEVLRAPVLGRD